MGLFCLVVLGLAGEGVGILLEADINSVHFRKISGEDIVMAE